MEGKIWAVVCKLASGAAVYHIWQHRMIGTLYSPLPRVRTEGIIQSTERERERERA